MQLVNCITMAYNDKIADSSLVLNFTDDSEICIGGGTLNICSKLFNSQEVIGRNFSSCSHSLLKNHTLHTISPPRRNAQAGILHIPRPHMAHGIAVPVCLRGFLYPYGKPINEI